VNCRISTKFKIITTLYPRQAVRKFLDDRRRAGEEWLTWAREDQFTEAERQTVIAAMALLERLTRSRPRK
jgi:hypothetical protein